MRDADEGRLFVRSDLLVLLTLSCWMNADGTGAFPSIATLAQVTGLSDGQVSRSLKRGRTERFLHLERRGHRKGNGETVSNRYRAVVPSGLSLPRTDVGLSTPEEPSQPRTESRLNGVSTAHETDLNLTSEGSLPRTHARLGSHLEDGQEEGGVPGPCGLVTQCPEEVPPLLAGLVAIHNQRVVDAAVNQLTAAGASFRYSSELRKALEQVINDFSTSVPATVPTPFEESWVRGLGPSQAALEQQAHDGEALDRDEALRKIRELRAGSPT